MTIADVKYENADRRSVSATIDGVAWSNIVLDQPGDLSGTVNAWVADGNTPADPDTVSVDLASYAANARFQKEVAGVLWRDDLVIQTDRDSQSKMLSEFVAVSSGMRTDPSVWKFADNKFAMVSNADMSQICLIARNYVANAFAVESNVQAHIADGSIATTAQIDAAFIAAE